MRRLTADKPTGEMNMVELAHNCMYTREGWAWYRDFEQDMDLRDYIRKYNTAVGGEPLPDDNGDLENELLDDLQYAVNDVAGQVALTYRLMWALADVRQALKAYEDTGLTPEEIMIYKMLPGWIPVEERLPEENGVISDKVLIAQGVHDKQISFGWLRNGIWVTSDMVPFARQELITHWMPLPDKPLN